jgi:hypothetical protein
MISAPSRLLPLNGNKLLLLAVACFLTACGTRNIQKTSTEVVPIQPPKNKTRVQEDSIVRKPEVFDIDRKNAPVTVKPKKSEGGIFNIAVILPFNLDQIPLGMYADDSTRQLAGESKNALAFYTGCQMALEHYVSDDLNANVYFLDDDNDSSTLAGLFRQKPFPSVDYIVGPLTFKNLKTASDLSRKNQIPLLSPVSNSMYITDNPFYFNAYPSLRSQYAFLMENAKKRFPGKTLEVIYDGTDSTAESIHILKEIDDTYFGKNVRYTSLRAWDDIAESMTLADTTSERVMLIYSSKDAYVKAVIAKLKGIRNDLTIFTSAPLKYTKNPGELKTPHTIYTVSPFNTESANYGSLALRYEQKAKRKPEELVILGYDIMMHLFRMLEYRQPLQDKTYNASADFNNAALQFDFRPVRDASGHVDYHDNYSMYLYKFVNGAFVISTL